MTRYLDAYKEPGFVYGLLFCIPYVNASCFHRKKLETVRLLPAVADLECMKYGKTVWKLIEYSHQEMREMYGI